MAGETALSGKYKPYPEYKDSGVGWLDGIPLGWALPKLKYKTTRIGDGLHSTPKYGEGTGFYFVNGNNLGRGNIDLGSSAKEVPESEYKKHYVQLDQNSVLLSINGTIGNVSRYNNEPVILGKSAAYINCTFGLLPEFLMYYLQSCEIQRYFDLEVTGTTIYNLSLNSIRQLVVCKPVESEQQTIANFLDHETAKIDTLIDKQQQLITLLKEKRQAVISHAVTKGLNPNAPMRDSGVEWLGKVPEHWIVRRLKHISPKVGVGLVINPSTYTKDEGVYFIFGGDVKEYKFDLSKTRRITPEDSDNLLPSRLNHRDLVAVRVGYPGITAVVTEELEGANCASVIVIRRGQYNSDWLCAAMNAWVGRQQVDLVSYGAAQKQFNVADAIEFVFPLPPIEEQDDIAIYVERSLNRFNTLTEKAELQINLLQERRTALISAAVTGKIDVRNWQEPIIQEQEVK
jgi:type I restriction enzyme S subunit